jgi:hypothetical protein
MSQQVSGCFFHCENDDTALGILFHFGICHIAETDAFSKIGNLECSFGNARSPKWMLECGASVENAAAWRRHVHKILKLVVVGVNRYVTNDQSMTSSESVISIYDNFCNDFDIYPIPQQNLDSSRTHEGTQSPDFENGGGEKAEEEGERKGRRRKRRERLRIPICDNRSMSCADPSFLSHISFP